MTQIIHLHWLYKKPSLLRGVVTAATLCGEVNIPRDEVTSFPEDATCKTCKAKYAGRYIPGDYSPTERKPKPPKDISP